MPGIRLNDTERHLSDRWGGGGYPFPTLRSISISGDPGLRGIKELNIDFEYPLTVICGKNGCGKTTILALAALGFHSPPSHIPINARRKPRIGEDFTYYTFQDFFFKGPSDPDISGLEISWKYQDVNNNADNITIKKRTEKWMHYERRPVRPVHYLGVARNLPAIEQNVLRSHFKSGTTGIETRPLNDDFRGRLSDIMGRIYDETDIMSSSDYSLRKCRIGSSSFSSFNSGSGEDVLIDLLYLLQKCEIGSLIVVEEIELGIHPEALIRLARNLLEIIERKKLQVIVSTHSEYFIDSVPRLSRVLIQRANREHIINKAPTTRFAMGIMAGRVRPELNIYCEDYFAELLIKQSLPNDLRSRTHIVPVGSNSELINQAMFHLRAEFGQHILIFWDGDTRNQAKNWLRDKIKNLISHHEIELNQRLKSKMNWDFLPGNEAPERWLIKTLNSNEGFQALGSQLNCPVSEAEPLVTTLLAMRDPHYIGHELSQRTNLEEEEALQLLARSVASLGSRPLGPIAQTVRDVLANRKIKQTFKILT